MCKLRLTTTHTRILSVASVLFLIVSMTYVFSAGKRFQVDYDLERNAGSFRQPTNYTNSRHTHRSVFFMKTHKTGSSAIQNIFMRYAIRHGLTVATGKGADYSRLCIKQLFHRNCVRDIEKLPYDIIAHHLRYNKPEIVASVKPDAKYISIVRDPNDIIHSAFTYFQWNKDPNTKSIADFIQQYPKLSFDKGVDIPYKNLMMYVFGLQVVDFQNEDKVQEKLKEIEDDFDLILINEYMLPSLILMKELLNWTYEDVACFHVNKQTSSHNSSRLDLDGIRILRRENSADQKLYDRFYFIFKRKVRAYGEEKMMREVEKLQQTIEELQRRCLGGTKTVRWASDVVLKKYELSASGKNDALCQNMVRDELSFTKMFMS